MRAPRAEFDLADRGRVSELVGHPDGIADEVAPDDAGETKRKGKVRRGCASR
jgi:hypothetical protein